jgi:hypothetical protein
MFINLWTLIKFLQLTCQADMDQFKKIAYKTVLVAGILLSLLTAASLSYDTGLWFLQVLNFPRLCFFIALAFCLVFTLVLKKWHSIGNKLFIATVFGRNFYTGLHNFPLYFFCAQSGS